MIKGQSHCASLGGSSQKQTQKVDKRESARKLGELSSRKAGLAPVKERGREGKWKEGGMDGRKRGREGEGREGGRKGRKSCVV